MRIVITGGNGFIGATLTEALNKLGHQILVLDNFSSSRSTKLFGMGLITKFGYYEDTPVSLCNVDIEHHIASMYINRYKPDLIIHLAANLSIYNCNANPRSAVNTNILGSMYMYETALKNNCRIIFAESSAVYEGVIGALVEEKAAPHTVYAATKYAAAILAESLSITKGLEFNSLRYFNITGEGIDYTRTVPPLFAGIAGRILANKPVIFFGNPLRERDFIHIDDVTAFNLMLVKDVFSGENKHKNKTFNVGTGNAYSLLEIAQKMHSIIRDKPLQYIIKPEINGEAFRIVADMTYTKLETGFTANKTIDDMVASSLHFVENEVKAGRFNLDAFMTKDFNSLAIIGVGK